MRPLGATWRSALQLAPFLLPMMCQATSVDGHNIEFVQHRLGDMAFDMPAHLQRTAPEVECHDSRCSYLWRQGTDSAELVIHPGKAPRIDELTQELANPFGHAFSLASGWMNERSDVLVQGQIADRTVRLRLRLGSSAQSVPAATRFAESFRCDQDLLDLRVIGIAPEHKTALLRNGDGQEFTAQVGDWLGSGRLSDISGQEIRLSPDNNAAGSGTTLQLHMADRATEPYREHHVIGFAFELPAQFPRLSPRFDHTVDSADKSWSFGTQSVFMTIATHVGSPDGFEVRNARGDRFRVEVDTTRIHIQPVGERVHFFFFLGDSEQNLAAALRLTESYRRVDRIPGIELLSISTQNDEAVFRNELGLTLTARENDQIASDDGVLTEIGADYAVVTQLLPTGTGAWREEVHRIPLPETTPHNIVPPEPSTPPAR